MARAHPRRQSPLNEKRFVSRASLAYRVDFESRAVESGHGHKITALRSSTKLYLRPSHSNRSQISHRTPVLNYTAPPCLGFISPASDARPLARGDLDFRHVQRLHVHQDDFFRGGKGGDGYQSDYLALWSTDDFGAELGLAPDEVEVRTRLHDEGVVILKGVAPCSVTATVTRLVVRRTGNDETG
jgi:hypothetical protein